MSALVSTWWNTRKRGGDAQRCVWLAGWVLLLAGIASVAGAAEYASTNPAPIQILDFAPAAPYPSIISVANVTGVVVKVTVTLKNLTHTRPLDIGVLLVGPEGQSALLLSGAGGFSPVTGLRITFDDVALAPEREFDPLVSGIFQPSGYNPNVNFPPPAPTGTPATALAVFNGSNPNGDWRLFVVDDEFGETGQISEGWSLTITAHSRVFANPAEIMIPDVTPAVPYPSTIQVSGVDDPITKVTVTLNNLHHTFPADLDMLLVGPSGASVVLMSDAGAGFGVDGVTLTFDDSALDFVPEAAQLVSGEYRATNYGVGDVFVAPAPAGPYGTALSVFYGTAANGVWQLFVVDDTSHDFGRIADGWQLAITTEKLVITAQQSLLTRGLGETARLRIGAGGIEPLAYQWRLNGAIIGGATNSSLILSNLAVPDFGTYSVTVANQFGATTSEQAPLLLDVPAVQPSDGFSGATLLTDVAGLVRGTNLFAGKEPGEPNHANRPGGKSVWYDWFAHDSGVASFSTQGSGFDTLLAVYTGSGFANLATVVRDDDRGGFFTSAVRFNAVGGQTYHVAIDGLGGDEGTYLLQWSLDAMAAALPVMNAQPASQSVGPGAPATFTASASGAGLSYQWFFFTNPIFGATGPTLTLASVHAGDVGTYTLRVSNSLGQVTLSDSVVLEIGPVLGFQSDKLPEVLTVESGTGTPFISVRAGQSTLSEVLNNTAAITSSKDPNSCGTSPSFTRWICLQPQDAGEFEINTEGSSIPTILAVYTVFDVTRLQEVDCDKSDKITKRPCRLQFPALPTTNYYVVVDGLEGAQGIISVNWKFGVHLAIARSGTNSLVWWTAPNGDYQLQSAPEVKKPSIWSGVTNDVVFDRGTNRVSLGIPAPPSKKILRLFKR